ncbi:MAG: hydrolase [Betaproteobacteria bacterium]|nr:hydrolase [Betaproteobacteria bacterium]MBV9361939.1 hydrolase [Betaproteobacteria bacterium]
MRVTHLFCAFLLASGLSASHGQSIAVTHQNRERTYLLHAPAASSPLPLVLVFHGGSDTPQNMETISGFSLLAEREHFIVAYPAGIDKSWNDGRGSTPAAKTSIDDVGFTGAVIADIQRRYPIDTRRIYATGPSNGGIFVLRLACEMADTFAAVGPVIGALATELKPRCKPAFPISIVGIAGVADPLIPFAGGEEGGEKHLGHGGRVEGARATQDFFASLEGCSSAVTEQLSSSANDGTSVSRRSYSNCRAGTAVVWYEIAGGGHRWHGHEARPFAERAIQRALGVSSRNIDTTQVLWEFFRAHPRP